MFCSSGIMCLPPLPPPPKKKKKKKGKKKYQIPLAMTNDHQNYV